MCWTLPWRTIRTHGPVKEQRADGVLAVNAHEPQLDRTVVKQLVVHAAVEPLDAELEATRGVELADDEVANLVDEAYIFCRETLAANRPLLDATVDALLEKETIDGTELDELVAFSGRSEQACPMSSMSYMRSLSYRVW